ncbi:MAG: hypothetical protein HYT72_05695 [Candidatus Aenigmarchaeota archaeon]|nr:hypothetical protein [Candidatus Aenigmarchaeota archaeon]
MGYSSAKGYKYSYRPPFRNKQLKFLKANGRHMLIIVISITLIFTFSTIANRITGFVLYANDIEARLNETLKNVNMLSREKAECSAMLADTGQNMDICNNKLTSSQSFLVACEKERDDLKSYSDRINSLFRACDVERKDLSEKLANETSNYKEVVRSSVKAICCSFGDSVSGALRNWAILNSQIVCSGNFTVNCTSGKTDF